VLAGDEQTRSSFKAELEASIEAHGLRGRVFIPGHCTDMPAAFNVVKSFDVDLKLLQSLQHPIGFLDILFKAVFRFAADSRD